MSFSDAREQRPEFLAAYRALAPLVRRRSRRIVRCEALAEDIAQEAFARLWAHGPLASEHPGAIAEWLLRTSTRLSLDALRARRRAALAAGEPAASPHARVEARATIEALEATLPRGELEAAVLVRVDGLSHRSAALELGVSERTLRRRLASIDAFLERARAAGARNAALIVSVLVTIAILFAAKSCDAREARDAAGVSP
ncbi:MAG: sigma-70 family RNA polymerase sigma factor [Polyangiaceae bacterium]